MTRDLYTEFLGVPEGLRPPDHYTLLGVQVFSRDIDAIEAATRQRLTRLDAFALSPDVETQNAVDDMINQVARARVDLATPERRVKYDQRLARKLGVVPPADIPPKPETQTRVPGSSKLARRAPIESDAPLGGGALPAVGKTHRKPKEIVSPKVRFEAIVWAHLQKWKLDAHEISLLLVEAFVLGLDTDQAMEIIHRMDAEAEVVAGARYELFGGVMAKRLAVLTCCVIVAAIIGLVVIPRLIDLLSEKSPSEAQLAQSRVEAEAARQAEQLRETQEAVAAMVRQAQSFMKQGLLDQAQDKLARAQMILPDDLRTKAALKDLSQRREKIEKQFVDALAQAYSLVRAGRFEQAERQIAAARKILPDDSRLDEFGKELASQRNARLIALLAPLRDMVGKGKLDEALTELRRMDGAVTQRPEYRQLRNEINDKIGKRNSKLMQLIAEMRSALMREDIAGATSILAQADAISPGDSRLDPLRRRLAAKKAAAARGPKNATLTAHSAAVYSVAFSPDGKRLISGAADKTVKIWDVETTASLGNLVGHSALVRSVAYSPNGKTIASVSHDMTVGLWNAATGRKIRVLKGHGEKVNAVAFSSDGKRLASAGWGVVKLWDVASGRDLSTLRAHKSNIWLVAFSHNGRRFASCSRDKTIKIRSSGAGRGVTILQGHKGWVCSIAFSPDDRHIASGSYDMTVKIWNAATGRAVQTLVGHKSYVYSVAYSPDGKLIASGSWDKTIKIWNAATGKLIATVQGHTAPVNSVVFSPDGKRLASASSDKTVKLWDATQWSKP
jgi:tricorn protease-like protein